MSVNSEVIDREPLKESLSNDSEEPTYKLYSQGGVIVATIFASVLAGGILMAINYKRLSNKRAAWTTLGVSFLALIFNVIIANVIPESVSPVLVSLPFLLAMGQAMNKLQGGMLAKHVENQGQLESKWKALGISLITALVMGVLFFFAIWLNSGN